MNKRELIGKIIDLPYEAGVVTDTLKINRAGLIKLIDQFDEPQKPVVPQFVAEWYEENKNNLDKNIYDCIVGWGIHSKEIRDWMRETSPFQTLVNMHQFGYEVEKEKRYSVKLKAVDQYLVSAKDENFLGFLQSRLRSKFTRKELENLGFDWVFDCPGIEIEEVTE